MLLAHRAAFQAHPSGQHSSRQATSCLYTIDTYIHVVADTASASPSSSNYITDAMITDQFNYLATAYTNASICFTLQGSDRTTNDTWAANGADQAMKSALRKGTYSALNIYYQSQLQSAPGTPGVPAGSTLLGYCSLPAAGVTPTGPPSVYVLDGCNVLSGTLPGGTLAGYNLGGTTAHEVGHWNGLLHTFQDNTCGARDFGDYVADTPQEMTSTSKRDAFLSGDRGRMPPVFGAGANRVAGGCPAGKDTCPASGVAPGYVGVGAEPYGPQGYAGADPVHNFMDYSTDACYQGFTPGQGARMLNIWQIYREGL